VQVSHLFWSTWSIFQAVSSEIDFDYLGYACLRLEELRRLMDEAGLLP
jgi:hypothetical protein